MQPHTLWESLLTTIEEQIHHIPPIPMLASDLYLSADHLQRIFKFAFGITLADYIRSRKLSASMNELLNTNLNIIDIAMEYGFEHEQSFIRCFKREFHMTPGEYRKGGQIAKVLPPLHVYPASRLQKGVMFGPDFVMVPTFHVAGIRHQIPFDDSVILPPAAAKDFWYNAKKQIPNVLKPNVFIGLTRIPEGNVNWSYYLPSVQVREKSAIPQGFYTDTFPSALCARFHYIGRHHYGEIDAITAGGMYEAILAFVHNKEAKYQALNHRLYFERIDTAAYDGTYCQMEWFTPVFEKTQDDQNCSSRV